MKTIVYSSLFALSLCALTSPAQAHFGMVIPSANQVNQEHPSVDVKLSFSHPFAGLGMDLAKPAAFYAITDGKKEDLSAKLTAATIMGHKGWSLAFAPKRPGVSWLVMEPQPYWEPAEDVSIIHYTKTAISAFDGDEGWSEPLGLKTEIVPSLRPFGNYAGNSFTGQVLLNGKPVAGSEVEVEFYNEEAGTPKALKAPSDAHITQVVKADANGVFSFTCPAAGWWGFAALNEGDALIKDPSGKEKGVELGAVLWLHMEPFPQAAQ